MWRAGVLVLALAGCGRIGFDPTTDLIAACGTRTTVIGLGSTVAGTLCPGDTHSFRVTLAAGEELEAALVTGGPGWPALEILDDESASRAVRTFERSISGFADHDGEYVIQINGVAATGGTPYELTVGKRRGVYVFVAPDGNDAGSGSFAEPWQHLDAGLARLAPGDTLVLKDGVYHYSTNGNLLVDCTAPSTNGIPGSPIRVTALTDRRAEIASDGITPAMRLVGGCQHWIIEGLLLKNADNSLTGSSNNGAVLMIDASTDVIVRRVLAQKNNRYVNSHVIQLSSSSRILIEDVEIYDFHRYGLLIYGSQDVTARRVYAASRGYADIAGGYASDTADKGDGGLEVSHSTNVVLESSIDEGNAAIGIVGANALDAVDVHLFGVAALGNDYGVVSSINTGGRENIGTHAENVAAIDSRFVGFFARSNIGFECRGCTALRTGQNGWIADELPTQPRACSAKCTGCLVANSGVNGFVVTNQSDGWRISSSNSFGNPTPYTPSTAPQLVAPLQIDPKLGGCTVYLPAGSPMRTAGAGGTPIGAQIIYRYRDGVPTDLPLWSPETGAFPCGAIVPGVNDTRTSSCSGVHTRLHVGTTDCPLPYPEL